MPTREATTLENRPDPGASTWSTTVPTPSTDAPSTVTPVIGLPVPPPDTNWSALYGLSTNRLSVTLTGEVIGKS